MVWIPWTRWRRREIYGMGLNISTHVAARFLRMPYQNCHARSQNLWKHWASERLSIVSAPLWESKNQGTWVWTSKELNTSGWFPIPSVFMMQRIFMLVERPWLVEYIVHDSKLVWRNPQNGNVMKSWHLWFQLCQENMGLPQLYDDYYPLVN